MSVKVYYFIPCWLTQFVFCFNRFGLSGGGALNGEVQDFIRIAFGIDFVQGYGLTETNAGLTIQATDDLRGGIAGVPVPSIEIKLDGTPEICDRKGKPYLSTDTVDVDGNPIFGRGEIMARGPSISLGYYMMPDQTKEVYEVCATWNIIVFDIAINCSLTTTSTFF